MRKIYFLLFVHILCLSMHAQITGTSQLLGSKPNSILTVPFITITPDARAAGMGDCGVATTTDVNSMHYNPAKYAFMEKKFGLSFSYVPWLRSLDHGISLNYFSLNGKIDSVSAIAFSLRYFSLNKIQFTDDFGASLGDQEPIEMAIDGAYSRKLSRCFSVGIALRFIYSNIVPNLPIVNGQSIKAGTSGAGDISAYYKNNTLIYGRTMNYALGLNLQNMGSKISYTNSQNQQFIPAMLKFGASGEIEFNPNHKLLVTGEISKLMITLTSGNNNITVLDGIFDSFHDSPTGFQGEIKEISWGLGAEYSFLKKICLRSGYFHESTTFGNRRYFTVGLGLHHKFVGFDLSYLLPQSPESPLKNTFRFGLSFMFGSMMSK